MFDLSDVRFVKRITVGSNNPAEMRSDAAAEEAMGLLNKCLAGPPRGTIIGMEKSFTILQIGEHHVVLQWIVYHVGFARKPPWVDDEVS